jgi:predicted nucleic acid-binding protein
VGAVALDACVAIAFLDPADRHHERAKAVLREHDRSSLVMAASAHSETLARPLAAGLGDVVEDFVDGLRIEIVAADRELGRSAAQLRAAHSALRLPDALMLATARARGADLLTFDAPLARLAGSYD